MLNAASPSGAVAYDEPVRAARLIAADRAVEALREEVDDDDPADDDRDHDPDAPTRRVGRRPASTSLGEIGASVLTGARFLRARAAIRAGRASTSGRSAGASAVGHRFERAREVVEAARVERPAHFAGRHRGPVFDRAAIAEAQQPGAEAQPDRALEIAGVLGVVGGALQRVGILRLGQRDPFRRARRCDSTAVPRPRPHDEPDDPREKQGDDHQHHFDRDPVEEAADRRLPEPSMECLVTR